uniref:Uncharacterized protein n=1 Tax=Setaria italica TaxID=4555 RepID=K4AN85_SETIT
MDSPTARIFFHFRLVMEATDHGGILPQRCSSMGNDNDDGKRRRICEGSWVRRMLQDAKGCNLFVISFLWM